MKAYAGKQDVNTHGTLIDHITSKLDNVTEGKMRGFMAESIKWTKAAQSSKDLGIQHDADELEKAETKDRSEVDDESVHVAAETQESSATASSDDSMSLA